MIRMRAAFVTTFRKLLSKRVDILTNNKEKSISVRHYKDRKRTSHIKILLHKSPYINNYIRIGRATKRI